MDNDSDTTSNDRDDRGHGGFRPSAGRKRKQSAVSFQVMSKKRRERAAHRQTMYRYRARLTQWIDELKWSHQGIQSSYHDNATALLIIFNIMLENINLTQAEAIVKAGLYLGREHSTCRCHFLL
ncbi:unnamed protein product [Rotaria sordida]|uniref:Uncharacterized protein n=1 Tax=Rotaria sordida TaxID=392033 RepID=A0A815HJ92_9BILA|nr:unnamed protein product [Rotaria sordida]